MKWYTEVISYLEGTELPIVKSSRKKDGSFYNVPVSFDIETTSFQNEEGQYCGIMYVWQFAINNEVFYGRTMEQYQEFCQILTDFLQLGTKAKLVVYVHNLAFEFQFIRKYFTWVRVFADKQREPMYADTGTMMYKCSYRLSGYSLAKLAENLQRHTIKKLVGDLDYSLIRHTKTPLTKEELGYCANDVLVVTAYIEEQIEDNGDITKIPLTSTGFVRRHIYEQTLASPNRIVGINYRGLMKKLTLNEETRWNPKKNKGKGAYENKEYQALKMAFQGGFTHASAIHSGVVEENVSSYDFTSSYPAVMLSEMFPMSKAEVKVPSSQLEFETMLQCYCVNFSIILKNVKARFPFEHYLSESRCYPPVDENGNVVKEVDMKWGEFEKIFTKYIGKNGEQYVILDTECSVNAMVKMDPLPEGHKWSLHRYYKGAYYYDTGFGTMFSLRDVPLAESFDKTVVFVKFADLPVLIPETEDARPSVTLSDESNKEQGRLAVRVTVDPHLVAKYSKQAEVIKVRLRK